MAEWKLGPGLTEEAVRRMNPELMAAIDAALEGEGEQAARAYFRDQFASSYRYVFGAEPSAETLERYPI